MEEHTLLCNLCEDWILEWGKFYELGATFRCLPCGHEWAKRQQNLFQQARKEGVTFIRHNRKGFKSLEPVGAPPPRTARCCTKIILAHGVKFVREMEFNCPVCNTAWSAAKNMGLGAEFIFLNLASGDRFRLSESGNYLELITAPVLTTG